MPEDSLVCLVPVLGRPQNVKPLVESWKRACPPHSTLCFICSPGDTAEIDEVVAAYGYEEKTRLKRPGSVPRVQWMTKGGSWPEKIALGCTQFAADWRLLAADDVTFTPGWWEATERFRRSHVQVIGTNDGANPRASVSGIHTTHPLVHRSFRAMGHPSSPVWPGYHHWHVDDELVWTAKARGVWAWCEDARVTHHHPYFDESVAWDDTYALGESRAAQDKALWAERAQMLGLVVA